MLPFPYLTPTAADFHAVAAAGGEMPVRFWLPCRGQGVLALFRPAYLGALAVSLLGPEPFVVWFYDNADVIEASVVSAFNAAVLMLQHDSFMLPQYRLPGDAPVVWSPTASAVQVVLFVGTVVRTYGWTPRLSARMLAARAVMVGLATAGRAAPITRVNHITLPLQIVALLLLAWWREQQGRTAARRAINVAAAEKTPLRAKDAAKNTEL